MENLNQALQYPDPAWAYFRLLGQEEKQLMDKLLVERQHPCVFEPGTNENRFRILHAAKFQF